MLTLEAVGGFLLAHLADAPAPVKNIDENGDYFLCCFATQKIISIFI
jgi:hypothetical protein